MRKFLKVMAIVMCAAMLVAGSVAATLAYLADKTDPVTNTFTAGNISIELREIAGETNKMVPGATINNKQAEVTVEAGSEDCLLFIKIDKSANYDTYLGDYELDNTWNEYVDGTLATTTEVYYRVVRSDSSDTTFKVFVDDNKLAVNAGATKEQYGALTPETMPTLTITAYAVQLAGFEDNVSGAWAVAKALETPNNSSSS